jgi:Fe2+ or Zn2+ uptake regulation protein
MVDNPLLEGLRAAGVSITVPRTAICEWLAAQHTHPTAAEIHAALQPQVGPMSLATVYNTLALLERLGLIVPLTVTSDGHKRYDVNTEQHANLVCEPDGEVLDVYDPALLAEVRRVAVAHGIDPDRVRLVMVGVRAGEADRKSNTDSDSGTDSDTDSGS